MESFHTPEADVEEVAVIYLWVVPQRALADAELQAGQAAAPTLGGVVTRWTDLCFAGAPHPQEPGTPVQQNHTSLKKKEKKVIISK